MSPRRYRQSFLILATLILPTVAIATLGWNDAQREREKQLDEAKSRIKAAILQELRTRLAQIRWLGSQTVAIGGWSDGERLILPWDADPNAERFRRSVGEPEYARTIRAAQQADAVDKQYNRATTLYREATQTARDEIQRVYAKFLLAQVLSRAAPAESLALHRDLLKLSSKVVNNRGIPLAYLVGQRMVSIHASEREVLDRLLQDLAPTAPTDSEPSKTVPANGIYILKGILETLKESGSAVIRPDVEKAMQLLAAPLKTVEQALFLQTDFPKLPLSFHTWQTYPAMRNGSGKSGLSDEDSWLIGMTPENSKPGYPFRIIAVRASELFKAIEADPDALLKNVRSQPWVEFFNAIEPHHDALPPAPSFKLFAGGNVGEPLGVEDLPGLRVAFEPAVVTNLWSSLIPRRPFYALSLLSVVLLTFFGGYLLWRDTQREVRIAELRSQFVSSVSHELKTPLTSIRMFADILLMRGSSNGSSESVEPKVQTEYLETIVNESERLTRLLNNVLDFSRIERGQKNYHMESASLTDIVNAAARTMRFPLADEGFDFRVSVADGIPPASVDRDAVEQAILNLLSNAMKYSGESREIDLKLYAENGSALIQVTDHGVGISEKEQKRIFEKFYRVPTPENRAIPGTGLGLALVAHIAEAHGGRVEVESEPGKGSTFSIRLPLNGVNGGSHS